MHVLHSRPIWQYTSIRPRPFPDHCNCPAIQRQDDTMMACTEIKSYREHSLATTADHADCSLLATGKEVFTPFSASIYDEYAFCAATRTTRWWQLVLPYAICDNTSIK